MKLNIPKECQRQAGVYIIRNTINPKVYIGSTNCLIRRYKEHCKELRAGRHTSDRFLQFVQKYGLDVLAFEVLVYCEATELLEHEQLQLDKHDSSNKKLGFNIMDKAGFVAGVSPSQEVRERIRAGKLGKPVKKRTAEHQEMLNAIHRGAKRSDEARANMSAAAKGKPKSPESIQKRINTLKARKLAAQTSGKLPLFSTPPTQPLQR